MRTPVTSASPARRGAPCLGGPRPSQGPTGGGSRRRAEIVVEEARGVDEVELPAPELDRRLIEATPGPLDEVAIGLQDAGSCEVDCAELVGKAVQAGGQIIRSCVPEVAGP